MLASVETWGFGGTGDLLPHPPTRRRIPERRIVKDADRDRRRGDT
jgi:hypothetical protein